MNLHQEIKDKSMKTLWDACTLAIRLQRSGFSVEQSVAVAASPQDGIEIACDLNGQLCFVIRREPE